MGHLGAPGHQVKGDQSATFSLDQIFLRSGAENTTARVGDVFSIFLVNLQRYGLLMDNEY